MTREGTTSLMALTFATALIVLTLPGTVVGQTGSPSPQMHKETGKPSKEGETRTRKPDEKPIGGQPSTQPNVKDSREQQDEAAKRHQSR